MSAAQCAAASLGAAPIAPSLLKPPGAFVSAARCAAASLGAAPIAPSPLKTRFSISQNLFEMVLSQNEFWERTSSIPSLFRVSALFQDGVGRAIREDGVLVKLDFFKPKVWSE